MRIDALHDLTVNNGLQAEHTVGRWVLRTDVDYILVVGEEFSLAANELSVGIEAINLSVFWLHIVLKRVRVIILPVFAEWVALEVVAQEESAHVGVVEELDAVEVKHFTLKQFCHLP